MRSTSVVIAALLGLILCGCRGSLDVHTISGPSAAHAAPGPAPDPRFAGRLDAAKAIQNESLRDQTLTNLAQEATEAGDAATAKLALAAVNNDSLRDQVAANAASQLAGNSKAREATEIAKTIGNDSLRDQVLADIANQAGKK